MKLKTSTSFRALALNFAIQMNVMDIKMKTPSRTTILNWIHKVGYYQLVKPKEVANDWIIIIDESIQIGREKILMIFGLREKYIDFSRPLKFQDLVPLRELVNISWKGDEIQNVLLKLKEELGDIKYAVTDGGSNITKGLRLSKIKHVYDITHKIGVILSRLYKKNEIYISLTKKMSDMRLKYLQTEFAHLIPPRQRTQSRYLNIDVISKWCLNMLTYCENNKETISKKISWITEYKVFILEISAINKVICDIEKILKHKGFSEETHKACNKVLKDITSSLGVKLKTQLNIYFKELEEKSTNIKNLLITSDIIESSFGKYKNYISQNPMAGITNLILSIATFTCSLDERSIKTALENTLIYDIKKWTEENIGKTLFQKRKEAYAFS